LAPGGAEARASLIDDIDDMDITELIGYVD
jgi:hypothetical protein